MLTQERIFASLPRTERGRSIVLGTDPKGENFLYANGNSIFIRSLKNPFSVCDVYTQHSVATCVAKYSPSRFYIASGDISGKLRIWDTTQAEHILKNEFHVLGGPIRDLAWTGDSQRLVVVGDGRERFGVAILADAGTSVGDIVGHSKAINSVDVRQQRPFRVVTASEDFLTCFYEGPPFKFKKQNEENTNFVNVVRYSPDDSVFAAAGSSGKILLYDGKTSDFIGEFVGHKGGVYSLAFSPDSKKLLSVSGDKTARIWSVADRTQIGEWQFGTAVQDMQVSCAWIGDSLLTVSVDGAIRFLDEESPGSVKETIVGHSKPITALGRSSDGRHLVTGSTDATIVVWDSDTGRMRRVSGLKHKNQIQALAVDASGRVFSAAIDDTMLVSDLSQAACNDSPRKLPSQPVDVSAASGLVAVACREHLLLFDSECKQLTCQPAAGQPLCCALSPDATQLAVGTAETKTVQIFKVTGGSIGQATTIDDERQGEATTVAFSPDGAVLAAGFADRYVRVYSVANGYQLANNDFWCNHSAKITCLAWSPDSKRLASGSLDCGVAVWSLDEPKKRAVTPNAHPMSQITKLAWIDNSLLASTGQDSNIKVWRVAGN